MWPDEDVVGDHDRAGGPARGGGAQDGVLADDRALATSTRDASASRTAPYITRARGPTRTRSNFVARKFPSTAYRHRSKDQDGGETPRRGRRLGHEGSRHRHGAFPAHPRQPRGATGPLADRGDLQAPRTTPPANAIAAVSLGTSCGGDDRDEATEAEGRPHLTAQTGGCRRARAASRRSDRPRAADLRAHRGGRGTSRGAQPAGPQGPVAVPAMANRGHRTCDSDGPHPVP